MNTKLYKDETERLFNTRESVVEKKVIHYAKEKGWYSLKWKSPSSRGVPDHILFKESIVLIIEFKRKGETPTEFQSYIHSRLKKQGFMVHIIKSTVDGFKLLDNMEKLFI